MKKKSRKKQISGAISNPAINSSIWLIVLLIIFTLGAYLPVFNAGFVNWDDGDYVANNTAIRHFSSELITHRLQGNFHPLTTFSLAVNYAISGESPYSYHVVNLLLHLINTLLVFWFTYKLSRGSIFISFTVALLFGVHPMHVESVAWVSERKDVLYAFFFLLGLISYLQYTDSRKKKNYFLSFIWFILSLASKPAAVIFPLVLFSLDMFQKRKLSLLLCLEKLPYFIIAFAFGLLTVYAQKETGAIDEANVYSVGQCLLFGFFGFMMYFVKLIVPVHLSPFYPFPPVNEPLPLIYLLSPVFFLAVCILCFATWKKYREVAFGFSFYFLNLLLVLQFFIVGSAVIACRYTYIPYISLFYLFSWLLEKRIKQRMFLGYGIVLTIGLVLTGFTYREAQSWQSGEALWDHAIENFPSSSAYSNRASLFRKAGDPDRAIAYYNRSIQLNRVNHETLCNRGNVFFDKGADSIALNDYNLCLRLKPDYIPALDSRGALYAREGRYELAMPDLNRELQIKPDYKPGYNNRGLAYMQMKQYEKAIADFEKYLSFVPDDAPAYNTIGVCYQYLSKYNLSLRYFDTAIRIKGEPRFYLNRALSWYALDKMNEARADALIAKNNNLQMPETFRMQLGI